MRKIYIIFNLFVLFIIQVYSDEIDVLVTKNTFITQITQDNKSRSGYLNPGNILQIEESLWDNKPYSGKITCMYKEAKVQIESSDLINPLNWDEIDALKIGIIGESEILDIDFHPFEESKIIRKTILNDETLVALFDIGYFFNSTHQFVCTSNGKWGWLDLESVTFDNDSYYKNSSGDILIELDAKEKMLSNNHLFHRNGPVLNIPALDLKLYDNQEYLFYRVVSIVDDYIIYTSFGNHHLKYILNDISNKATVVFRNQPIFNIDNTLVYTIDHQTDSGYAIFSIFNFENQENIKKEYQAEIKTTIFDSIKHSYWTEENNIIINILSGGEIYKLQFEKFNSWQLKDENWVIRQFVD